MVFGISFHTMLQMVTSLGLLDNHYCRRILRMTSSFPNLFHKWVHRLITCLPISDLSALSIRRFADDRLNYNPDMFLMLCVGSSKIVRWIEFLYLILFGSLLHASGACCQCIVVLACSLCNRLWLVKSVPLSSAGLLWPIWNHVHFVSSTTLLWSPCWSHPTSILVCAMVEVVWWVVDV